MPSVHKMPVKEELEYSAGDRNLVITGNILIKTKEIDFLRKMKPSKKFLM